MTPIEKAKELVDKFSEYAHTDFVYIRGGYQAESQLQNAKQCALIAANEILSFIEDDRIGFNWKDYYKEVKQEIENF
jgi:hypothetical protein